ncbi:MAG: RHS repeat domain-containing protein [Armatimonadota bacterium]
MDAQGAITRGQVTAYSYDAWGRLEKVKYNYLGDNPNPHWPLSAPVEISTADVAYAYELPVGYVAPIYVARVGSTLRTSMIDSSGESEYTYDCQGRLKTYKPPIGLDSGYYVEYDYNDAGQKTQVKITNGTATTYDVTYDYFANGWLKNVKYNGDTIAEYSYDEVGNRTRQINGNGTYTDYTYSQRDARYMMSAITHYKMAGGVPVPATDPKLTNSIVYARDAVGNPLSITDSVGKWQYGYDSNNRLIAAVPPNPVPEQPAGGPYEYDWVGNRLNPPADPNPMVYNAADQLMSWPGMHTYTYYPDGSLYQEKDSAGTVVLKTYTYTPDGLLSTAEFNGKTLTNTWDADKNRVGFSGNSVDHTFVYDTTAGIPAVIVENGIHYIREPNGSLIARVSSSNTSYYHFDQLGSTRLLTNADGDVTDEYAYDAYGSLLSHNRRAGSVDQPYQYVGELGYYTHYQEPEFGLLQLGVRFYDAEVGGFTQRDPIGYSTVTSYAYAALDPVAYVDPDGRSPIIKLCYLGWKIPVAGDHSWVCMGNDCYGFYVGKGPGLPGKVMNDTWLMQGMWKNYRHCYRVVVSDCVYNCMMRKIKSDTKSPPRYVVGGPTCTGWVARLFNSCGFMQTNSNAIVAPVLPSGIGSVATQVNDSRNSNNADVACRCRKGRPLP